MNLPPHKRPDETSSLPFGYSQKLLESILNAGNDYICVKDRKGCFVYINEMDASLYNAKPQDMIGKTVEPWMGKAVFEEWYRKDMAVFNSGRKQHFEPYSRTGKDGITRWFDTIKIPFADKQDGQDFLLVIHRDITKIKEAELERNLLREQVLVNEKITSLNAELVKQTTRLEAANKELETFGYSVSHDLRAPLRHIEGYVDLLRGEISSLSEKGGQYLKVISDSAKQMGVLIDGLLAFSRMGRAALNPCWIETDALVAQAREELSRDAAGRSIEWKIETLPKVYADKTLFKQVWVNLLDNAIKYTRNRDKAVISIGCKEAGDEFEFFVKDNGAGFDMQYAAKLFGIFQRLHFKEEFEGTGIGLANIQRIIARHGGRTRAEGEVNVGATFYFTLPKASPK